MGSSLPEHVDWQQHRKQGHACWPGGLSVHECPPFPLFPSQLCSPHTSCPGPGSEGLGEVQGVGLTVWVGGALASGPGRGMGVWTQDKGALRRELKPGAKQLPPSLPNLSSLCRLHRQALGQDSSSPLWPQHKEQSRAGLCSLSAAGDLPFCLKYL